eukprot:scaffold207_cov409-Prasinococcus_capsulatus_cf.AAC.11
MQHASRPETLLCSIHRVRVNLVARHVVAPHAWLIDEKLYAIPVTESIVPRNAPRNASCRAIAAEGRQYALAGSTPPQVDVRRTCRGAGGLRQLDI